MVNSDIKALALSFLETSENGYAIFSPDDVLIYCNQSFEDLFCYRNKTAIGKKFIELVENAHEKNHGVKIESTTHGFDVSSELIGANRRKQDFRIFEVDLVDGRWMLFSEQVNDEDYLFVQCKSITRQKVLEQQLNGHVEELCEMASYDSLTNLLNRRGIDKMFAALASQPKESRQGALVVLDIDDFKVINDTYGHAVGDDVLIELGRLIKSFVRPHDLVGRIGGEEFVVYLTDSSAELASKIGQRLVESIAKTPIVLGNLQINVTVSAGLCWRDSLIPFDELYVDADTKLYKSKHSGKNKITV